MWESRCAFARSNISLWIVSNNSFTVCATSSIAHSVFSLVSRRTSTHFPASMSFGPNSTRTGIPRISCSENFHPGLLSLSSNPAAIPACTKPSFTSCAFSKTPSLCCWIGITMVCTGAILGGSTRPESSPCTMMIAPIRRVVIPQDV